MSGQDLPKEFLEALKNVKSKRARIVAEHILEHGYITTDDIRDTYGYSDPYRPTGDLRDEGIPLISKRVKNEEGRSIAAYRFGDPSDLQLGRRGGRKAFSKKFKKRLLRLQGNTCAICVLEFSPRYLQIDHRVPYQVAGDNADRGVDDYLLVCGSCNRSKSWSCEHCENAAEIRDPEICESCYWCTPASHTHMALEEVRRLDLAWAGREVEVYELVAERAAEQDMAVAEYVKAVLNETH